MKILIFENEIQGIKESFDDVNFLDFNGRLEFDYYEKSQTFTKFDTLSEYDMAFIDIDLSTKSEKDGYAIIRDLIDNYDYRKIVVMTGHEVKEKLKCMGWDFLDILEKPIFLDELKSKINTFFTS
jgi:DNA-binding NtrC family response regulator